MKATGAKSMCPVR